MSEIASDWVGGAEKALRLTVAVVRIGTRQPILDFPGWRRVARSGPAAPSGTRAVPNRQSKNSSTVNLLSG